VPKCRAMSRQSCVLPTAVGPVMTISVFLNCQLSIVNYLITPRLEFSMNVQM